MEDLVASTGAGALPEKNFWHGRRVLVSGHTGFKGSWLAIWLSQLGVAVRGAALSPVTYPNLFDLARISSLVDSHIQDIRDHTSIARLVTDFKPEVVFHLAAQPLVRASYADPIGTFDTNVMGTVSLLEALRSVDSVRVVVVATTDKVYQNAEQRYPFRETDPLGGHDPYSASKAASELVVMAYRNSFLSARGVSISTVRAGNVIGGGDWAQDRLIPDAVRAWSKGDPLIVRHPSAVRPWNHVLESLTGYLVLAERMWNSPHLASAWNFGPPTDEVLTVREVIEAAQKLYGKGTVVWNTDEEGPNEARWLTLENRKTRQCLGVMPQWNAMRALQHTLNWYRRQSEGVDAYALCEMDIESYTKNR